MRDGWTESTLGDIAEWFSGGTPKAGKPEFYENGTIPWVVIADMMKTEIFDTASKITKAGLAEIGGRVAPKGSVLISMYATVGRPGFAHIPVATNQAIAWSVPNEKMIQPRFLLLVAQFLESEISSMARGATQRNINRAMLKEFRFNLPPLDEQKRIVDVVSSVDAYKDALQQQAVTARTARNAVLHELLSVGGDNWTETTLGDIASWSSGKNLSSNKRHETGLIPILGANGIIGRTTEVLLDEELITVGRVGACGETHRSSGPVWISDNALIVIPKEQVIIDLLFYVLSTFNYQSIISGTTQPLITQSKMKSQVVNLPPLDEQKRIVEIVSSMDEVIRSTEQAVSDAKSLRSGLLSDLLSGEHEIPASYDSLLGAA